MTFELCWSIYPHFQNRSKKMIARAKYDKITGFGLNTYAYDEARNRVPLTLIADGEVILEACKAFAMTIEDRQFSPGFDTWLNKGRWDDWSDEDRKLLASKYDERTAKREKYIKLVK